MGTHNCASNEVCHNTGGSFDCLNLSCNSGYQLKQSNHDRYIKIYLARSDFEHLIKFVIKSKKKQGEQFIFRKCVKTKCRPGDNSCTSKPLQISYHLMNHTSPLQADRALFKMTLQNSDDIPKKFTLIKGNEKGLFQVKNS